MTLYLDAIIKIFSNLDHSLNSRTIRGMANTRTSRNLGPFLVNLCGTAGIFALSSNLIFFLAQSPKSLLNWLLIQVRVDKEDTCISKSKLFVMESFYGRVAGSSLCSFSQQDQVLNGRVSFCHNKK